MQYMCTSIKLSTFTIKEGRKSSLKGKEDIGPNAQNGTMHYSGLFYDNKQRLPLTCVQLIFL